MDGRRRVVEVSGWVYGALLRAYPRGFRDEYGEEMARLFADMCRERLEGGGVPGLVALWCRTLLELVPTALQERRTVLERGAYRYAVGVVLATALVLSLPLVAMQITDDVAWGPWDFAVAGVLLLGVGLAFGPVAVGAGSPAYRAAVGVALVGALLLVWMNLAVGVIGGEDDPANAMYLGVLAVGVVGAIVARLRPSGMSRALLLTALAQALVAAVALAFGLGYPWSPPAEILALNGFFVGLFAGSALLFRRAARRTTTGVGQGG